MTLNPLPPVPPKYHIPTYTRATDTWSYTDFHSVQEFRDFLLPLFKEPGKYNFSIEISREFNKVGRFFTENKYYLNAPDRGTEFIKFWDAEKEKCREGVIFHDLNDTFYAPRDWYMWINFLPIYNKEEAIFKFPTVYDTQMHVALYEKLAELHYKHAVILKKRQIAMSYFHAGKMINQYWFEEGVTLKLLASQDTYIGEEGTWMFLNEYRDFLNEHTAWYRPSDPDKLKNWQQKIQVEVNGRKTNRGNKSRMMGISTQQSPTRGVGGASKLAVFEEAGIAPTMDKTYRYMKPALEAGLVTVGMFVAYGSVGDLHQCEPLKKFMFYPEENGFMGVKTNLVDEKGTIGVMGLFIPEQWSMPPYIDEAGNSLVEEALAALMLKREEDKKNLEGADYQLEVSQHPINIAEAFNWREDAIFPLEHVTKQEQRVDDGEYPKQFIDLKEVDSTIVSSLSNALPILVFPCPKKLANKEGVIICYERPDTKAKWGTYYGSVDPVAEGKTTTSESLCSIIIYKNPVEVIKHEDDGTVTSTIEPDKIVCTWTGRFDDIKKTHQRLEYIIRWYNAWTVCEANVSLFINYMIGRNLQHFLVPKDQILFLKELSSNNGYHEFGWKNTGTMFKSNLLSYGIEFVSEELYVDTDVNGNVLHTKFGVERIPDKMLLVEMKNYRYGLNVDRLVAYCALIAFARIQHSSMGYIKRVEYTKNLENSRKNDRLKYTPTRNIGYQKSTNVDPRYQSKRSAFRHHR